MSHAEPFSQSRISLLHATRGRPEQALGCRERWLRLASAPECIEHLFAVDFDDALSQTALASFNPLVVNDPRGGCVGAWNMAAEHSTGDVLVQLSDDWVPPQDWDQLILSAIGELSKPSVLRVSDGHRTDDLLCIAILTRPRLKQQGFLFSPEYQGVYSDDEFSFRACKEDVILQAPDICFTHAHPHYDPTVQVDQTYLVQNSEERKRNGLLTFARRNPDAFGKWVHHGTDQRHYHEEATLPDVQLQLVEALAERNRLLEREANLMKSFAQLKAEAAHRKAEVKCWTAEAEHWKVDAKRWKEDSKRCEAAVANWNRRSWFARAVHKLRINAGNHRSESK